MLALIQQYKLIAIGLAVAVLMALSAAGAWNWQANAYGQRLASLELDHARTLGDISTAAAVQLKLRQAQRAELEARLSAVDRQRYQELTHAQQTTDRLTADLAAARQRLSVRTTGHAGGNGVPAGTGTARVDDGVERADIHPEDAAAIVRLTGEADRCAVKLSALQGWVVEVTKGGRVSAPRTGREG